MSQRCVCCGPVFRGPFHKKCGTETGDADVDGMMERSTSICLLSHVLAFTQLLDVVCAKTGAPVHMAIFLLRVWAVTWLLELLHGKTVEPTLVG